MADKKEDVPQEPADTYHRHGELDPSGWEEQPVVTDRPNDIAGSNSTFAERAKAAKTTDTKAVERDDAENKSVRSSQTSKKAAR
jgi:hypothetical protein